MKMLLVRPKPHKDTINLQSFMICEPLDLEYLAARAEQLGHEADIVDLILESKPLEYFLSQKQYDIVGFTGYLPHVRIIKNLAAAARKAAPGIITLVGGVHAEVMPEDFEDTSIDFIMRGNALASMEPFLAMLKEWQAAPDAAKTKNERFTAIRLAVPGLWESGKPRCPVDTSFNFPLPARSKTQRYRNRYSYGFHNNCASIKTSFGCPYQCEFCFCVSITQGTYFERPLPEVIGELRTIEETNIFVVDDNFLLRRERVAEFCRLMRESGLKKHFILFGRTDFITENEDLVPDLKEAGVRAVFVGVESFKQAELGLMNKKCTVEKNIKALHILEDNGIHFYAGLLANADWEKKDFDELIRFLGQFKHPIFNFQPVTPLPGTPFYERTKDTVMMPRDQAHLWDLAHILFTPQHMSQSEFYKNILRVYYSRAMPPRAHLHILRTFGLRAYLRTLKGSLLITLQYLRLARYGHTLG